MGGIYSFPFFFQLIKKLKYIKMSFKQSILAFSKNIVSKKVLKAIDVILSPCCSLSGEASVSCNDDNTYEVVVTTNEAIGFLGLGVAEGLVGDTQITGIVTEPNTIYFEIVDTTAGTKDFDVKVFLPTNTVGNSGVFKSFTIADVVFPSCV